MSRFRHGPEVRAAQAALDANGAYERKAGIGWETDEYLRLNDAVNDAIRAEKSARRGTPMYTAIALAASIAAGAVASIAPGLLRRARNRIRQH